MDQLTDADRTHLRAAIELAARARWRGDAPFGARLVGGDGTLLGEAGNSVVSTRDCTAHAEMNLLRAAWRAHPPDVIAPATLYASAEPCAMCAGAICWSGVARVVYGSSAARVRALHGEAPTAPGVDGRTVLVSSDREIAVVGPALEDEASRPFARGG